LAFETACDFFLAVSEARGAQRSSPHVRTSHWPYEVACRFAYAIGVLRASQRGFMVNGEGKLSAGTVQILAGIQASARGFFILYAHQPASSGCASEPRKYAVRSRASRITFKPGPTFAGE
jgi:hypothetical protein